MSSFNIIRLTFITILTLLSLSSCKKDESNDINMLPASQRAVEIIGFNSDYQDCKEEFTYKDSKLLSYNYYQKDFKGDWILHRKFLYEYPAPELKLGILQQQIQ